MAAQLHDLVDPLQQCGYCVGWAHAEPWSRIRLTGDDDGGVQLSCRECGYTGLVLAYLGWHNPRYSTSVARVESVADLLTVGERHVVEHHSM